MDDFEEFQRTELERIKGMSEEIIPDYVRRATRECKEAVSKSCVAQAAIRLADSMLQWCTNICDKSGLDQKGTKKAMTLVLNRILGDKFKASKILSIAELTEKVRRRGLSAALGAVAGRGVLDALASASRDESFGDEAFDMMMMDAGQLSTMEFRKKWRPSKITKDVSRKVPALSLKAVEVFIWEAPVGDVREVVQVCVQRLQSANSTSCMM